MVFLFQLLIHHGSRRGLDNKGMMTPADFAALIRNNEGSLDGNGLLYLLFFMIFFTNGYGGGGNGGYATSNEVQRGFDAQNSMANQRETLAAVNAGTAQAVATTNQTFHDTLMANQGLYNEIQRDIAANAVTLANIQANQNECCCSTKMLISETSAQQRYDSAMQYAQLSKQIDDRFNQIELSNAQRENAELRQRMSALENGIQTQQIQADIAAATAGVVRYPNTWAYNAGPAPFCGCGSYNI